MKLDIVLRPGATTPADIALRQGEKAESSPRLYPGHTTATDITLRQWLTSPADAPAQGAADARFDASVLSLLFSFPIEAVSGAAQVAPAVLSGLFTLQTSVISGGALASPSALQQTVTLNANVATGGASVAPTVLSVASAIQPAAASGVAQAQPAVLAAAFSMLPAVATGGSSIPEAPAEAGGGGGASNRARRTKRAKPSTTSVAAVASPAASLGATVGLQKATVSAGQRARPDVLRANLGWRRFAALACGSGVARANVLETQYVMRTPRVIAHDEDEEALIWALLAEEFAEIEN